MDSNFNVECFLRSLRATKPPWECPKCKKIYKSYAGIEYHLLNFDHTAPAHPVNKPTPISRKSKLKFTIKKKSNRFNQRPGSPVEFKSPTRDTLTWAEAQRMVEVESEGRIYRLNITEKLDIISDSDVEKDEESLSNNNGLSDRSESEPTCKLKPSKKDLKVVEKKVSTPNGNESINTKDNTPSQHVNKNKLPTITAEHKLPKPSFRLLSDYDKETVDAPVRSSAYYRYIEKPLEDLEEEVEYDMDEEDAVWLELMNEHRSNDGLTPVTHNQLELLMDRFEKESYFEQAKNGPGSQGTQPLIDEDAVCCVCNDGECQNSNVILFCDMCNLAVHQECYGVPYIPEGQWLCRRCLQSPSCPVDCCLCPSKSGAFKQTDDGRWSHVVCALWVPEVGFGNTVFLEPIDGLKNVPQARWRLTCYVCKQRNVGACIQCHRTNCYIAFHVTCAQQAGLYMKMEPVRESGRNGVTITVKKEAYCDAHTPLDASPRQNRNKGQFVFDADDKKSSEKLKKTRKILAEKRQEMPHIAIPHIPRDKISSIGRHLSIQKKGSFMQRLLSYWTLKRQSRNGVPLLRRLQSHVHAHKPRDPEAESQQHHLMEQLKYWHRLRHDLERARLLIELLRKREKLKREAVRISQVVSEMQLTPFIVFLRRILDNLRAVDVAKVFAEPVKQKDAPDYHKIVKQPMDFLTMATKIDNHKYKTIDDFEEDFDLVVKNCLFYNSRDTIFYRLGVKMRDHGGAVLREAKREAERCGFDSETGMLLVKTPEKKIVEVFNEKTRLKLPLQEQLEVMYGRLDQAILKSRKTRKIRTEISSLKRRMLQKTEKKEASPEKHSLSNSKEASTRRFSADDADTSNTATESEAVVSDVGSGSKVSPKIRPVPMKRPVAGRKRLWSARTSLGNSPEPQTKKGHLERSESCPLDNDITRIDTSIVCERLSPVRYDDLPKDSGQSNLADDTSEDHVDPPTQTPEKSNSAFQPSSPSSNSGSVNRRSAVLFKKKPRDLPINLSGTDTPPEINEASKYTNSQSESTPTTCNIKPSCSPSRQSVCEVDTNGIMSDLAEDDKKSEDLVNGFNESEDESIFKGKKTLKRHESFRIYRGDAADRHSSSDSDTASSGESANRHYRKRRSHKKKRRHSYSMGYVDKNPYQSDAATSETSNDDQPCLILGDIAATQKELFRKQSYVSTTEDELEDDELPSVKPLDLVWAKYRGYPPYPALLIDPKMPRSGFCHNGVPIPVPPIDVLQVGDKRVENGNHRIYLVLFFDTKRTWQWLPRNKLEPLGLDTASDQSKLSEGRRPALRKNVEAAYKRALLHRSRVTGEIPDSDEEIRNEPERTDSDSRG